jgi:signal transduction histidine kinase/CheY-like chemotaxis protein
MEQLGNTRDGRAALEPSFELLAGLTARLASTASLDEIVDTVLDHIVLLGFGAVWMAVLDEGSGNLLTLKEVIDGVDTTHEMPKIFMLDMRQPIGHGFRERRMINIPDPDSLHIIDRDDEVVPPGTLALPRIIYQHMRGHPFACGPLLGSRGQPVGALGLSSYHGKQPIPDELFARGLLRTFMDHLGIAMERALHLSRLERLNADLQRAQASIARDARTKAIGELAAAVAHDLNNLSGVALMAASIGRRSPADAHDVLPRIERANRAIGDLVGRLQRVARSQSAPEGVPAVTNLAQVVEDILAMVSPILREQSVAIDVDLAHAPPVRADHVTIHQVVLNLILNAKDALEGVAPHARRLGVQTRTDGAAVRLVVRDTGPGIAPDVLAQLFQPFVTTKAGGHVGLGLAAAHASLKHLGGSLAGENATDGGAVFTVTLEAAGGAAAAAAAARGPLAAARPRDARILAVDDDPDVAFIVRAFLEPLGYRVAVATTADQALSLARTETFDLVLCDVGLPGKSGLDVCHALRESGFGGKLVLMTGWDGGAVKADGRAAACDTILGKPFMGEELLQVIDALLVC